MSVAIEAPARTMTVEEFLELPEDGVDRELIRGELRERGMTVRNRFHAEVLISIGQQLKNWLDGRPQPRGKMVGGEAGFRLRGTADSLVGIDIAYVSVELAATTGPKQKIFDGPPVLAVEITSPSDTQGDLIEKLQLYLEAGVVVWEVDPDLRTVRVHRPGAEPVMFNVEQELSGEPELPGFRAPVAKFFES